MSELVQNTILDFYENPVYIMVGIPGSGKSTWIKNNLGNINIVSRDIIRAELGFTTDENEKVVLDKKDEALVTKVEYDYIRKYCAKNVPFVIDDTNTGKYRKELINVLRKYNRFIIGINMHTPLDVCIERRKGQIPAKIMKQIYQNKQYIDESEVDKVINVSGI